MQTPCHITVDPDGYDLTVTITAPPGTLVLTKVNGSATTDSASSSESVRTNPEHDGDPVGPRTFWFTDGGIDVTVAMTVESGHTAATQVITLPLAGGKSVVPILAASGGSGTSSPEIPSATPICRVDLDTSPAIAVPFGVGPQHLDFTGATLQSGEDFSGGDCLPLGVTIDEFGDITLPDDDRTYDVFAVMNMSCDVSDAGKMVALHFAGNDGDADAWAPVKPNGTAQVILNGPDRVYAGSGPVTISFQAYSHFLTVNATITSCFVTVYQRP